MDRATANDVLHVVQVHLVLGELAELVQLTHRLVSSEGYVCAHYCSSPPCPSHPDMVLCGGGMRYRSERHAQLLRIVVHLILFFREADARTHAAMAAPDAVDAVNYLLASYVQLLILCEQVRQTHLLSPRPPRFFLSSSDQGRAKGAR